MPVTDISPQEAATYITFAAELADAARPLALSYFRTPLDVISKLDDSPVTIADRAIEKHLREMIEARFPDHGIHGEEFGVKEGNAFTWVLDPIDGTKSFITGFPLFGTLVSLTFQEKPFCGLIDIPATGERWQGRPGETLFAGKPAHASGCENLSSARFYTTSPDMFVDSEAESFERLPQSQAAAFRWRLLHLWSDRFRPLRHRSRDGTSTLRLHGSRARCDGCRRMHYGLAGQCAFDPFRRTGSGVGHPETS